MLTDQRKFAEAETLLRFALDRLTRSLGPEHPDTLDTRRKLTDSLAGAERQADARAQAQAVARQMQDTAAVAEQRGAKLATHNTQGRALILGTAAGVEEQAHARSGWTEELQQQLQ